MRDSTGVPYHCVAEYLVKSFFVLMNWLVKKRDSFEVRNTHVFLSKNTPNLLEIYSIGNYGNEKGLVVTGICFL